MTVLLAFPNPDEFVKLLAIGGIKISTLLADQGRASHWTPFACTTPIPFLARLLELRRLMHTGKSLVITISCAALWPKGGE